jgi:hypothetical protein
VVELPSIWPRSVSSRSAKSGPRRRCSAGDTFRLSAESRLDAIRSSAARAARPPARRQRIAPRAGRVAHGAHAADLSGDDAGRARHVAQREHDGPPQQRVVVVRQSLVGGSLA